MLKRTCLFVATLSFLVVLGLPVAQAQSIKHLTVQVPFDFYVRDRLLPAGTYSIKAIDIDGQGATLRIRNEASNETVVVLTNGVEAKGQQMDAAHVVLNRHGEHYFLKSAWRDASSGRALLESQRERSLQRELARATGGAATPEAIAIAAELGK